MANDKSKKGVDSQPITKDDRFASVHNDPRFKLPNLNRFKVKVDSRFSKKELEKLSAGSTGKKSKIDRYGRKVKEGEKRNLDKFYEHESEDEVEPENDDNDDENEKESEVSSESEDGEDDDEEEDDDDDVESAKKLLDRARGEISGTSSSEEDSDSSDSDESDEVVFEEEESEIELEDTKPEEGDPTDSFAVVNMDWDNLRAVDLMATFLSFVPANGLIKSVTIFPSEYGKEQMQKEEIEGPPRELFKKKSSKAADDDSDSDSDIDVNNADDLEKAARKLYTEENGEEDYDSKALRRYQLQRLRYYYAVVKCDSVNTAKLIYDNCDGTEFESTANIFDLRYIPEDMEFDESEAKDTCTKIPASYKPESNFVTDALQHSKVKLTWDETPKERQNLASRQFSQKEIDEMDFKAYLASDTEESEEEANDDAKNKYKNLLGGLSFGKDVSKDREEEEDVDMEITFNPGLDEQAPEADQKTEEEESTIAAYKRKEKERRKRRMEKFKKEQEENKAEEPEQTDNKSKNKNKNKHNKNNKNSIQDEKNKAELELIMMDEENKDQKEHFSMRDIVKAEKLKNRKKNKKNAKIDTEMTQDNFKPDLNDSRFDEIFENHDYAIDPTSSEFKKTETMKQIMSERSKRNRHSGSNIESNKKQKKSNSNSSNAEISTMVDKLKRKSKNNRR